MGVSSLDGGQAHSRVKVSVESMRNFEYLDPCPVLGVSVEVYWNQRLTPLVWPSGPMERHPGTCLQYGASSDCRLFLSTPETRRSFYHPHFCYGRQRGGGAARRKGAEKKTVSPYKISCGDGGEGVKGGSCSIHWQEPHGRRVREVS